MRKTIVYLSLFLSVLWILGHRAYGQTQACNLQVGTVMAGTGETITIPLVMHDAPDTVQALGFDLTYDPHVLQYTGTFARGALVEHWSFFDVSAPKSGTLRVGGFTVPEPIVAGQSGTLVELSFLVICNDCGAGEMHPLTPTDLLDDIATWNVCPGAFHVNYCVPGQGLTVRNSSGTDDTVVSIPVNIAVPDEALHQVEALGFDFSYDPQILQYTGAFTRGALVENWSYFDVSNPQPGTLRIGGFTVTEVMQAGDRGGVVDLKFRVVCPDCTTGDTSRTSLTALVDDLAGLPACGNTFTFGCLNHGDVDTSGELTPNDALLVFQHFLHLTSLEGCMLSQSDADGNGEVTPADALEIFLMFLDGA